MNKLKIYSYAKVNLSLRVIKKLNDGFHKIQSLVAFVSIYDNWTYNNKKYICNICGNKYNSIDNAMICIDAHNNEEVIRS